VIVTIGIQPTEPATGYGYIKVGATLPPPTGHKPYRTTFFKAEQFREKPDYETALTYVNSGRIAGTRVCSSGRLSPSPTDSRRINRR
jgi:mannose-1-phosphate guanylyltransferase